MGRRPAGLDSGTATVRVGSTMAVPAVLRSLGVDPAEVLAEAGLDPGTFDDPNNRISYAARGRLFARCAAKTGCAHFGLLVGQQAGLYGFGMVGFLVRYSPDVGTALRSLTRYLHLHVRGAVAVLSVTGDRAMLSYEIHHPEVEATDQIGDGAVAIMLNIMRDLCGRDWKPAGVLFAHRKPADPGPYRRFFASPLIFNAEHYAVVFPARLLREALPGADPELLRLLQAQIDALEAQHGDDFAGQVRGVLRTALLTGRAGAEHVAAIFSMHARTLNRRLNAVGTNFQVLLDECRYEIARQMLSSSDLDVAQIADALDYADASAFTRAFRRWSADTPAHWRAQAIAAMARGRESGRGK